ncbi:MAG TPA: DUF1990 family protein [Candidatus Lumbricidophila sp.]|nr:DUF1990 family protein [Candidatus Lumbricidophila sp.]
MSERRGQHEPRRSSFRAHAVSYGSVGATADPEVLRYPPQGFRATEDTVKIGSGAERFERAAAELMSWTAQLAAGWQPEKISVGTGSQYAGLRFDEAGKPLADQSGHVLDSLEPVAATEQISAGMTAVLRRKRFIGSTLLPILIVYVIDEPNRVGFAYGTTKAGAEIGERLFVLEHRDDDSVWFTVRSVLQFTGPFAGRARRRSQADTQLELQALHPAFV